MSYAIAQLRKISSGSSNYMENVNVEVIRDFQSPDKFSEEPGASFNDFGLKVANNGFFQKGSTYYLRISILRVPYGFYSRRFLNQHAQYITADDLTFTLLLKQINDLSLEEQNPPQVIDTFTIKSLASREYKDIGANTKYQFFTTVFTPTKSCPFLGFRLDRGAYDALAGARDWLTREDYVETITAYDDSGNPFTVETKDPRIFYTDENGDIAKLINIVPTGATNVKSWLKIGFQSRPGVLVVINQQPIRVGRSGIYQINNGTPITSFMITAPGGADNSKIDAFLLDYAYNSGGN